MKIQDIINDEANFARIPVWSVRCIDPVAVTGTTIRRDHGKGLDWYIDLGLVIWTDARGASRVCPISNVVFMEETNPMQLVAPPPPQPEADPTVSTGHVAQQGPVPGVAPVASAPTTSLRDMVFDALKKGKIDFSEAERMLASGPVPLTGDVTEPNVAVVPGPVSGPAQPSAAAAAAAMAGVAKRRGRPPKSAYASKDEVQVIAPNKVPLSEDVG